MAHQGRSAASATLSLLRTILTHIDHAAVEYIAIQCLYRSTSFMSFHIDSGKAFTFPGEDIFY